MSGAMMTGAQARYLLRHWVDRRPVAVGRNWSEATARACIRKGFLETNGADGKFPSGAPYDEYDMTAAAFTALGVFFAGLCPAEDGETDRP